MPPGFKTQRVTTKQGMKYWIIENLNEMIGAK